MLASCCRLPNGYAMIAAQGQHLAALVSAAGRLNERARPHRRVTYSRKVFLPLTNLCRDRCGYCTFVKAPGQRSAHTMTPDEVVAVAAEGARLGCKEALFSLGDHPEWRHPEMADTLRALDYGSTPEYVAAMSRLVLEETGLLPHTNCGLLDRPEMEAIAQHNASMGLMLESVSPRLLERGGPHFGCESKAPELRLATLELAGELGVAMTTGILIGIGERPEERVDSLLAIRDLHRRHSHIQEVIIQNFRAKQDTRMRRGDEPSTIDMLRTLATARLLLGAEMNIQAPPNLNADGCQTYLLAGINDWGGVSPLTVDFINPEAPWPQLAHLRKLTAEAGYELRERLALYPEYVTADRWQLPGGRRRASGRAGGTGRSRETGVGAMVKRTAPLPELASALERLMSATAPELARILDNALAEREVSAEEGALLFEADGPALLALMATADELRRRAVGDTVTYVVNRNINFTNVCIKRCGFCAFSRDHRQEEGYFLPLNEVLRRAREAWDLGATEVCIQAGLPPKMDGNLYVELTKALMAELPELHIHGFSPEEVLYGAVRSRCSIEEYLRALKDAGVGSLPGTSAEILDQAVRDKISRGRITVEQWTEVITTAHRLGIPTTSTIMFGHVESNLHRARHITYLRDIQKATGGITEFVPLSFVHSEAPMHLKGLVKGIRPGATGAEVIRMHAIARIMLHGHIPNIQCSWVKEGTKLAQVLLAAGCNDVGGTLINESISTAAGATHGQLVPPSELRRFIRDAGRTPAERTTLYEIRRVFDEEPAEPEPLDVAAADPDRFGSYQQLIKLDAFRYEGQRAPDLHGPTLQEARAARDGRQESF